MKEFAAAQWKRALDTLETGKKILQSDPDSAASRAYYAAFHALTAYFALQGQSFTKHSALRSALHRELIKPGRWPAELGRDFDFLMDMRETGDYGGIIRVTDKDAQQCMEKAKAILDAVKKQVPEFS